MGSNMSQRVARLGLRNTGLLLVFVLSGAGCSSSDRTTHGAVEAAGGGAGAAGHAAAAGGGAAGTASVAEGEPDPAVVNRPAFAPDGMPIMAEPNKWTWVAFDAAKCRSGSPAGIGVNPSTDSPNLMIYLEGGGACFDAGTCATNPDSVTMMSPGTAGVFDRTNADNPVKDWSFVYVPYCTGDVHMGANPNGHIDGVMGTQQFVGRLNMEAFMRRVVPTFSTAKQVLLTGISAGGFGAASNASFVQRAFGKIPVTLVDDSGPTMSEMFVPKCLYDAYRTHWGLGQSILRDCGDDCEADGDYAIQFFEHTARAAEGRFSALIESKQDSVIRGFYGIGTNNGKNDCQGTLFLTSMDAKLFGDGLLDYRERAKHYPGLSTYYPDSTQHTWLGGPSFYTNVTDGVKMVDFVRDVLAGKPAAHVGGQ
jgi:hypothetical protein